MLHLIEFDGDPLDLLAQAVLCCRFVVSLRLGLGCSALVRVNFKEILHLAHRVMDIQQQFKRGLHTQTRIEYESQVSFHLATLTFFSRT